MSFHCTQAVKLPKVHLTAVKFKMATLFCLDPFTSIIFSATYTHILNQYAKMKFLQVNVRLALIKSSVRHYHCTNNCNRVKRK